MKAVKPKTKSKKSSGRFARVKFTNKESGDNPRPDLSQLRKPIDISVSSLIEVTKLLETGGDEIKSMLAYECDVIYECRVCRSLFRSLANFISHKRVYCTENFNVTLCRKIRNDHIITAEPSVGEQEPAEDNSKSKEDDNNRILRSQVVRQPSKKDLTSVLDMLQKKQCEDINENLLEPGSTGPDESESKAEIQTEETKVESGETKKDESQLLLEAIDTTNTAVYQTVAAPSTVAAVDLMKAQMTELQGMVDQNTAILQPDGCSIDVGQLEKHDNPVQLYMIDDEENTSTETQSARNLVCSVCNAKFATRKTLTYHMKSLHVSYRTCYPCPCCDNTFANTWSVYRHLFKVHRKSNVQVRKLRSQIQEKAFRKETTGAEDIEKENARIKVSLVPNQQPSNNTQEWMEHFELDLELQRCGGCGRRFDRRAALISHSQFCQKRAAACNEAASGTKSKRLSKTPSPNNVGEANNLPPKETTDRAILSRAQTSKKKIPQKTNLQVTESPVDSPAPVPDENPPDMTHNSELSIRVENVSRISDADWEMIESTSSKSPPNATPCPTSGVSVDKGQTSKETLLINVPDSPEVLFTSIDEAGSVAITHGPKKRRVSVTNNSNESTNGSADSDTSAHSSPSKDKEVNSTDAMTLMENRIATIANLRKLQCLPCHRKFTSMTNLRRHMAVHIGWHRYRCKLCDYKCFVKCDCVAHCNKVHDAKNNRAVIADMVIHIPPDQSALAQEIMMDLSNSQGNASQPELIDVSESSPKSIDVTEGNSDSNDIESLEDKSEKDIACKEKASLEASKVTETLSLKKSIPAAENLDGGTGSILGKMRSQAQAKSDKDPDLKKIMEVIFGNTESGSVSQTESKKISQVLPRVKTPEVFESELPVKINEATETTINNDNARIRTTATNAGTKLEEFRPQRPTRNRVKPVHEDFIYDLTELLRKESAGNRDARLASQKSLKRKQLNQQQTAAAEVESSRVTKSDSGSEIKKSSTLYKMPGLLSLRKGESFSYNGKLTSLKHAEVKLNPLNELLSKNIGHAKISVSSHK